MNERIKELAKQSNIEFTYDPTEIPVRAFVECWEDELEKFAELIVKECVDIAKDVNRNPYLDEHHHARQIIKNITKHFGVE
jgi:ATP-dependent protease HslVU (ClpYQ) peptidase subunit